MVLTCPLSKRNGSELPKMDILSLFRQTTCSASASTHMYSYSDSRKLYSKNPDCSSSSSSTSFFFKQPTTKLGLVIALILSRYTRAYMILDAQNLHTFSQSRQTPRLQPRFTQHFPTCRTHEVSFVRFSVFIALPLFQALCHLFGYALFLCLSLND